MRVAKVYFKDMFAGYLVDKEDAFIFTYDTSYLTKGYPLSVTLPLQEAPFVSNILHPFFDGLIVEGWLLNIAEANWKIDPNDRFGLLMLVGKDAVGAVSVIEDKDYGQQ